MIKLIIELLKAGDYQKTDSELIKIALGKNKLPTNLKEARKVWQLRK